MRLQGNGVQEGFQLPCGGVSFSSTEQQGDLKSKANTNSGGTPGCEETSYCPSFHYEGMRMKEKSPLFLFQAHDTRQKIYVSSLPTQFHVYLFWLY